MEALIFSDSHGHAERMEQALLLQVQRPDAVFFAGDGVRDIDRIGLSLPPVHAVLGNCDWFSADPTLQTELLIPFGEHRVLLTHGHMYSVKHGYGALLAHAVRVGADLVLFGHTHDPHLEILPTGACVGGKTLTRPLYLFNSGSIGMDGSFGTLSIRGEQVLFGHGKL